MLAGLIRTQRVIFRIFTQIFSIFSFDVHDHNMEYFFPLLLFSLILKNYLYFNDRPHLRCVMKKKAWIFMNFQGKYGLVLKTEIRFLKQTIKLLYFFLHCIFEKCFLCGFLNCNGQHVLHCCAFHCYSFSDSAISVAWYIWKKQ